MTMQFASLNEQIRRLMLDEVQRDLDNDRWHQSPRLTAKGLADWPKLLQEAVSTGTVASLVAAVEQNERLHETEQSHTKSGDEITKDIPTTAAETLAEGEFNRYYIRAVCRAAIAAKLPAVEVYRAKAVQEPRPSSQAKLGTRVAPQELLDDLRASSNTHDNHLGIPAGPNSGLSVRLPAQ